MDFEASMKRLQTHAGTTQEELDRISKAILAMATSEPIHYAWEQKIESLVRLAKAVGNTYEVADEEAGADGHKEARRKLLEAYREFCEWRHDEPYVVDEIKALLKPEPQEYTDEQTGMRLTVVYDIPEHPLITVFPPEPCTLSLEEGNAAIQRLLVMTGLKPSEQAAPGGKI